LKNDKKLVVLGVITLIGFGLTFLKKKGTTTPPTPIDPTPIDPNTVLDINRPKGIDYALFNKSFGNIKNKGKRYAGEITPKGNKHKKFSEWKYGAAGMIAHLQRYLSGGFCRDNKKICTGKLNTIEKLVYVYAPPIENDTEGYIKFVVKETGFKRDQILNQTDKSTMWKLTKAMSKMESRQATQYYTEGVFNEGWEIAKTQNQ
jgi:hypothetical protein